MGSDPDSKGSVFSNFVNFPEFREEDCIFLDGDRFFEECFTEFVLTDLTDLVGRDPLER